MLSYSPTYPIPGETVTLSLVAPFITPFGGAIEWELTAVPTRSALALGKLNDLSGQPTDRFVPDVPGQYAVKAYNYRLSGYAPPRYPNDPISIPRKRLLSNETGTVHVAASISMPITTTRGHGSTLTLRINDSTVRAAELGSHANELSRIAAAQSAVTTALGNLVGVTIVNLGNNMITAPTDLYNKFEAHRVLVGGGPVHINPDNVNVVGRYPSNSIEYTIGLMNELYAKILNHTQTGPSGTRWHTNDDAVNVPIVGKANNLNDAVLLFADLGYRVYERHRVLTNSPTPAVHGAADNTNAIVAAAPLSLLIVAYLDAIAELDPTAPSGESEGANDAAHRYGFAIAP